MDWVGKLSRLAGHFMTVKHPRLRRIARCIGSNQKNHPILYLVSVRRYKIFPFASVVLYLCIGKNQRYKHIWICIWFGDTKLLYRSQPCPFLKEGKVLCIVQHVTDLSLATAIFPSHLFAKIHYADTLWWIRLWSTILCSMLSSSKCTKLSRSYGKTMLTSKVLLSGRLEEKVKQ